MSLFSLGPSDPWTDEPPDTAVNAVIEDLFTLAKVASEDKRLSNAANGLGQLVADDHGNYRTGRKLFVVLVPELIAAISTVAELSDSGADLTELQSEIDAARAELLETHNNLRKLSGERSAQAAGHGLSVLREKPLVPRGRIEQLTQAAARAAGAAKKVATNTAGSTLGVAKIAGHEGFFRVLDLSTPVTSRVHALASAIGGAGTITAFGSLAAGILFPPAVPFMAWVGYMALGDIYTEVLNADLSKAERIRKLRQAGASEELVIEIAKLSGKRLITIETEHVLAEMDLMTRQIDGMVLTGRHLGQKLSKISQEEFNTLVRFAPNSETRQILVRYKQQA